MDLLLLGSWWCWRMNWEMSEGRVPIWDCSLLSWRLGWELLHFFGGKMSSLQGITRVIKSWWNHFHVWLSTQLLLFKGKTFPLLFCYKYQLLSLYYFITQVLAWMQDTEGQGRFVPPCLKKFCSAQEQLIHEMTLLTSDRSDLRCLPFRVKFSSPC